MNWFIAGCMVSLLFICMIGISGADVPDLVGNWSGPFTGYSDNAGFIDYDAGSFSMNITEQKDRIFAGFLLTFDKNGSDIKKNITGIISSDGKDLYLAEQSEGFSIGKILGTDELELIYIDSSDPLFAGIDHLFRVI